MQEERREKRFLKSGNKNRRLGQIVILCGGKGIRLRPMTERIPKVLARLNGRPILDYILNFYRSKGFYRFTLCVGYKAKEIKDFYSDIPSGTEINFSDIGEEASMLERIWALKDVVDERFLVSYGDTFINLDIDKMIEVHLKQKAETTVVTAKIRNPFGLVTFDRDGWVTSFVEKPMLDYYIGSFLIEKRALSCITPHMLKKPDGEGLVELFSVLTRDKKLAVFEHEGANITFNTESEREKAEKDLRSFYTLLEESNYK